MAAWKRIARISRSTASGIGELHAAGVSFISGVDSGINPVKRHGLLPSAIVELVAAGVPAATALASATSRAAGACGLADRTGRLRPGLDAESDRNRTNASSNASITAVAPWRIGWGATLSAEVVDRSGCVREAQV